MTSARTEQLAPGVHRVSDGLVNLYLVEEGGRVTVVDTGWPRSWSTVRGAVQDLGRSITDVAAVLLTHGHPDHLGAAEKTRKASGAPVRCGPDERERVLGRTGSPWGMVPGLLPKTVKPSALGFVLHATVRGFLFPEWVSEVETVTPGQALDAPGSPVAVETPGHTEGHVSYHLPGHGVLVSGDALVTLDPLSRRRGPQVTPPVLCTDHDLAVASLDALAPLEASLVLPGHGEPFRGSPQVAVERARAALDR